MNRLRPLAVSVAALLPVLTPLLAPPVASAQTWQVETGSWGVAGNWSTNSVPDSPTAAVVFPGSGLTGTFLDGITYTVNKMTFTGGGTGTRKIFDGTVILTGNNATVNVGPAGGGAEAVRIDTGAILQLDSEVRFDTSDSTSVLFVHNGTITGTGTLAKRGPGSIVIDNANTYSGGTLISEGTITIRNGGALGTGDIIFGSATPATLRAEGNITLTNPKVIFSGGTPATLSAAGGATLTLPATTAITISGSIPLAFGRAGDTGTIVLGAELNGYDPGRRFEVAAGTLRAEAGVTTLAMMAGGLRSTTVAAGATLDFNDAGIPADENRIRVRDLQGAGRVHTGSSATTKLSLIAADFSGAITGAGAVLVNGAVALSGNSTYSGGTRLNSGQLTVGNSNALGSGTLEINGGTLRINGGMTIANPVAVRNNFTLAGNGFAGTIAGNVDLGDATRTITLAGALQDIIYANFSGVISGSGGLTVKGMPNILPAPSMLFLDGDAGNTYTGLTTVGSYGRLHLSKDEGFATPAGALVERDGRLVINNENQQIQGTLTVADGGVAQINVWQTIDELQGSGLLEVNLNDGMALSVKAGTFSGSIHQVPGGNVGTTLTKDGPEVFTFTGTSNHSGGTLIRGGGTLAVNSDGALGDTAGKVTIVQSRLRLLDSFDMSRDIALYGAAEIDSGDFSSTLGGDISGPGMLVKTGSGTLRLTENNTYTGGTVLREGRLGVGVGGALGTGGLQIEGGTLQLTRAIVFGNDVSVQGDFTLAGDEARTSFLSGNINLGNASRTITLGSGSDAVDAHITGIISGAGGLTISSSPGSGSTMALLGGSGNDFSGVLTIDRGADVNLGTVGGFAAPAGALIKNGGLLLLTGDNQQIQGTATIETGGSVTINRSQTIDDLQGSGSIDFSANSPSALTVLEGTFSGDIHELGSNPVSLIKDGAGRLTLTGTSHHTGGTSVRGGGTLAVGSAASLGGAGNNLFLENSTLEMLASFDDSRAMALTGTAVIDTRDHSNHLSGVISGTGSLSKTGSGTLRLAGTNTYSGGTSIQGGVLEITVDANLGAAGGDLRFSGGTLRLLTALSSARNGAINAGGARIDTNGFDATLTGAFSGEGGDLHKAGAGKLTLTGQSTFTGDTIVEDGTLVLNGSVADDVFVGGQQGVPGEQGPSGPQVFAEAVTPVFGGSGRIGGSLYNLAGVVAPGNSPGILTVGGNYQQGAAGTLQIEIAGRSAAQFDQLLVGGTATLDGTVQFITLDGFQPRGGDRFVFLSATQGITGTFATVLLDAPLVRGRVDYTNTSAALSFARRPIAPIFNGGDDVDDDGGVIIVEDRPELPELSGNQTAVAHVLDAAINDSRLERVFDELDRYSLAGIPNALDLIAPEELSAMYEIGIGSARVQAFNLDRHLSDLRAGRSGFSGDRFRLPGIAENAGKTVLTPDGKTGPSGKDVFTPGPENRWSVFLSGSGEFQDIEGDGSTRGYDITTSGFTLGADYRVCEGFAMGVLAGYSGTGTDLAGDGHILVNSGKLGLYATGFNDNWYLSALAAGGYNSYAIKRQGLGGKARGDTDGGEFTGFLSGGYDVHAGAFTVGPFVEAQYTYVGYGGFEERGSAAPLDIQSNSSSSLQSRAGVRLAYQHQAGSIGIRPELRVGWQHEYLDRTRPTDSRFSSGAGDVFRVEGPEIGRDSLIVNASVSFRFSDRLSTYVSYDGELGRQRYESHTVSGGVGFGF